MTPVAFDHLAADTMDMRSGTDLAGALVQWLASEAGVRVLFIKGATSEHHRLRDGRGFADVDLLVEPGKELTLHRLLVARGWLTRRTSSINPGAPHSITMWHPGWPCDIDLHRYFPGLLAPASRVFEAMWEGREDIACAGRMVTVPGRVPSALIELTNIIRERPLSVQQRMDITQRLQAGEDAALRNVAVEFGALLVLIDLGGARARELLTSEWLIEASSGRHGRRHAIAAIRTARGSQKVRAIRALLFGGHAGWRAHLYRLMRGALRSR